MADIPEDQEQSTEIIAFLLNLTTQRIRQLVKEGLPKNGRNKYPMVACIHWYIDYLKRSTKARDTDTITKTKKRLLLAQAEKAEIEVKEKKAVLIHIDKINNECARNALSIRNRLLAMPPRLAQMLEMTSTFTERQTMIDKEIKTALSELANFEN